MAKFRYRMQNILDIKRKLESQARVTFSQANARYLEEEEKLQTLVLERLKYDSELKEQLSGNLDILQVKRARENANTATKQICYLINKELELEGYKYHDPEIENETKDNHVVSTCFLKLVDENNSTNYSM